MCAKHGDLPGATRELDRGAAVNQTTVEGWSALHWASHEGHGPVVSLLLARKADVMATNTGETELQLAAWGGHLDAVSRLVLEGNMGVDKQDTHGSTALMYAADDGHLDVVSWLVREGKADVEKRNNDGS